MTKQTKLMLVEEFSEKELEAISGGAKQEGLVNVDVSGNEVIKNTNIGVAAQALTANSSQTFRQIV